MLCAMQQRALGPSGRTVSEIGLGCWQLGAEWGHVEEREVVAILTAAVDAGIGFFDTADIYGDGRSERLIGQFLQETGADVCVATKLGRASEPGWPANFTLQAMRAHVEGSLRRLAVDALDLVQLHCVPPDVLRRGEVFDHLRTLQAEGRIKAFGASVEGTAEAQLCLAQEGLASLQVIFNVFRQTPIEALFDTARRAGVAVIARLPLASGLLSGRFDSGTTFAADDHRTFNRDGQAFHAGETFAGLPFQAGLALVEELRALLPEGFTLAQMAQRWILDHAAVTAVITGCSRAAQVRENAACSALPGLPADLHIRLRELWGARVRPLVRGQD